MSNRKYKTEGEVCLKTDMQMYAQVSKMLGNRWVEALCLDGKTRRCRIRGSFHCGWVALDSLVLISLREYQPAKSDVLLVYRPSEIEQLKLLQEIPENFPLSVPERLRLTLMNAKVKDRRSEFFKEEDHIKVKVGKDMVWNGAEWEKSKRCVCKYCIRSCEQENEKEEDEDDEECSSEEDEDCSYEEDDDCSYEEDDCLFEEDDDWSSEEDDNCTSEDNQEEYSEKEDECEEYE